MDAEELNPQPCMHDKLFSKNDYVLFSISVFEHMDAEELNPVHHELFARGQGLIHIGHAEAFCSNG